MKRIALMTRKLQAMAAGSRQDALNSDISVARRFIDN
jgi:hypothetical protein